MDGHSNLKISDSDLPPTTDYMLTDAQYQDLFTEQTHAMDATYAVLKLI